MNNTFSPSRFGLLLSRQWIENRKVYLASAAVLFGCIALFYLFNILTDHFVQRGSHHVTGGSAYAYFRFTSLSFRTSILALSGIVYITLLAGHYYARLSKPATAIQELTVPVSATEKLLGGLVSCSLLTMLTFVAVFLVTDAVFVTALKAIYSDVTFENDAVALSQANYGSAHVGFNYFYQGLETQLKVLLPIMGFLLSSVFTLGSVYFRRMPFIKTGIGLIVLIGALVPAQLLLNKVLRKGQVKVTDFAANGLWDVASLLFLITITVALWAATYFRLKEKEV